MLIELLRQPMPPLGQADARGIDMQFTLPVLQRLQQLYTGIIHLQPLHDAESLQASVKRA